MSFDQSKMLLSLARHISVNHCPAIRRWRDAQKSQRLSISSSQAHEGCVMEYLVAPRRNGSRIVDQAQYQKNQSCETLFLEDYTTSTISGSSRIRFGAIKRIIDVWLHTHSGSWIAIARA